MAFLHCIFNDFIVNIEDHWPLTNGHKHEL